MKAGMCRVKITYALKSFLNSQQKVKPMIYLHRLSLSVGAIITLLALPQIAASHASFEPQNRDAYNDRREETQRQNDTAIPYDRYSYRDRYKRGGYVETQYRRGDYQVNDWHNRNLRQPPRGYRWVRNDSNQFIMIAIVTGLISEIVEQNDHPQGNIWYHGERISPNYLGENNRVTHWQRHGLRRPARGHFWVMSNHQYLLIERSTGNIAQVITRR
jgi:Ni/Co efflux regulator RcnB